MLCAEVLLSDLLCQAKLSNSLFVVPNRLQNLRLALESLDIELHLDHKQLVHFSILVILNLLLVLHLRVHSSLEGLDALFARLNQSLGEDHCVLGVFAPDVSVANV